MEEVPIKHSLETTEFPPLKVEVVQNPHPAHVHSHDLALDNADVTSVDYDSFDEQEYERPTERWAPLGAAVSPTPSHSEPK